MPTIAVVTDYPVAVDSPDHLCKHGTATDNSVNERFNYKIGKIFPGRHLYELSVLDMGCSGGGFIQSLHNAGTLAVGLEGSDHSKRKKRCAWASLSDVALFTADITRPFSVYLDNQPCQFNIITAWEVLEHLPEERLQETLNNMLSHLAPGGLVIVSISPEEEIIRGQPLHLCVHPRQWWIDRFTAAGFTYLKNYLPYFNGHYIRGVAQGAPTSFPLVFTNDPKLAPSVPHISCLEKLIDSWLWIKGRVGNSRLFKPKART